MMVIISNPAVLLALTFMLYYGSAVLQKKFHSALISPVVITAAFLIGYLMVFNLSFDDYQKGGIYIEFWLKPSVVALAVPLYLQMEKIKKQLVPLMLSQFFASIAGILSVCYTAKLLGAPREIILSLAPKSVTTPIAVEVSSVLGGMPPLTTAAVILTGMLGSIFGIHILRLSGISKPMGQGLSLGSSSHGLGVMAAMGLSEKFAAFATIGLIMNGIFTAFLAPLLVPWIL